MQRTCVTHAAWSLKKVLWASCRPTSSVTTRHVWPRLQAVQWLPPMKRRARTAELQQHPTMRQLSAATLACLPACGDVALSNIATAHSRVPLGPADTPQRLLVALISSPTPPSGCAVTAVLRLCARATVPPPQRLARAVAQRAAAVGFPGWTARHLSSFAWALAVLRVDAPAVYEAAAATTAALPQSKTTLHSLSLLSWALVTARASESGAADDVLARTAKRVLSEGCAAARKGKKKQGFVDELSAVDRSQLLWAFATVAKRRVARAFPRAVLHAASVERKARLLHRAWPHVPVLDAVDALMAASVADAATAKVCTADRHSQQRECAN